MLVTFELETDTHSRGYTHCLNLAFSRYKAGFALFKTLHGGIPPCIPTMYDTRRVMPYPGTTPALNHGTHCE